MQEASLVGLLGMVIEKVRSHLAVESFSRYKCDSVFDYNIRLQYLQSFLLYVLQRDTSLHSLPHCFPGVNDQ